MKHYCYILQCSDGSFYTGCTNHLQKRLAVHNEGKGARYTRARRPCRLVYWEEFETKKEAMQREYEIKHKYSRKDKERLITGQDRNCRVTVQ